MNNRYFVPHVLLGRVNEYFKNTTYRCLVQIIFILGSVPARYYRPVSRIRIYSHAMNTPFDLIISLCFFVSVLNVVCAERILPYKIKGIQDWVSEQSSAQKTWELKPTTYPQHASYCESWRFGVETNSVRDWQSLPSECVEYAKDYLVGNQYQSDLEVVVSQSIAYANGLKLLGDGRDAWVFDIDETLLSNLPYYQIHQYGGEIFDEAAFDRWVDLAKAPALSASHRLYTHILRLGIKVFLLTGRDERQRNATETNLVRFGYHNWEELILRGEEDHGKSAVLYKSERRSKIEERGFRIRGNSGDQWSDLSGYSVGDRSFKLPNPMYYIA